MLLFRSNKNKIKHKNGRYLLRVLCSFIILIFFLDLLWSYYSPPQNKHQLWQQAFFIALEPILKANDELRLQTMAQQLKKRTGLSLSIDTLSDVHFEALNTSEQQQTLQKAIQKVKVIEINQQDYLIKLYPDLAMQVRIGPLLEPDNNGLSSLSTLGFYMAISLLIWLWIRPLVQGLDALSHAAKHFSENYKKPLPIINTPSPMQELVNSFNIMAEKIRSLLESQRDLTGGLSHELRTPLARIKFALAGAQIEGVSSEKRREQFESIDRDVNELEALVDAMLNYCRLEQTEQIIDLEKIDANHFLNVVIDKYKWSSGASIDISVALNSAKMQCDQHLMQLAISNLVGNASRYAVSHIRVSYSRYSDCNDCSDWQIISVSDDGPGIEIEQQQLALQAFKKINTQKSSSNGFGLGLAIVNRIGLLHSGKVTLHDAELGGLEVRVAWPWIN